MKTRSWIFVLICLVIAGTSQSCKDKAGNNDSKIRKKAISIAEKYAMGQLNNGKMNVAENGIISISDDQKRYIIDPARVFTGLIDEDSKKDALVTLISIKGQDLDKIEQLIILNTNGKLMLIKSLEQDMKILELKDGVITAELHTHPRNTPLYYCSSCIEIAKFRYKDGELVKIQ